MAPSLSFVFIALCLGLSSAFVVPSGSFSAKGVASCRGRVFAGPAARQRAPPLFMAEDDVDPEIMEKVRKIVVSQLAVEENQVVPSASFTQDLGADSLDTVELIMALEEGFDIEIEDEVAAEIGTVKQAVDFIAKSG